MEITNILQTNHNNKSSISYRYHQLLSIYELIGDFTKNDETKNIAKTKAKQLKKAADTAGLTQALPRNTHNHADTKYFDQAKQAYLQAIKIINNDNSLMGYQNAIIELNKAIMLDPENEAYSTLLEIFDCQISEFMLIKDGQFKIAAQIRNQKLKQSKNNLNDARDQERLENEDFNRQIAGRKKKWWF